MKKLFCIALALALMLSAAALAEVALDEANFPDAAFRAIVAGFDADGDGVLSDEEIAAATELNCPEQQIASLKGVEYLTALTFLNCAGNQLTELDLSANTELTLVEMSNNPISAIDLTNNVNLVEMYCCYTDLTEIDVSSAPALVEFLATAKPHAEEGPGGSFTAYDGNENWFWVDSDVKIIAGDTVIEPAE